MDDGAFVIGSEGILTEEETLHSLKVRFWSVNKL